MLHLIDLAATAAVLLARLTQAAFSSTGQTLQIGDVYYFAPAKPLTTLDLADDSKLTNGVRPVTVLNTSTTAISKSGLSATLEEFASNDDVFCNAFSSTILVLGLEGAATDLAQDANFTVLTASVSDNSNIPSGPYFVASSGELYTAWRLYTDFAGAFTETIIPSGHDSYSVLPANIPGQSRAIAVPSRLYYSRTEDKPLAGFRIGMKDIFDMKGLRTSNGNRAWYHLYPPAEENAVVVQRLVGAGAIIVGKMHTSQFANGETPTADWVDYHAPFNPRGDGYQSASSSSTGPGAGAASYGWLDAAVGSDTGGSIRNPSQVGGLYGNRPTHNVVPLTGAMPLSPDLDTAGFLLRDPMLWAEVAKALYLDNITISHSYPEQIKTYGLEDTSEEPGYGIVADFIKNVSEYLGAELVEYDYIEDWGASRPAGSFENISEALNTTYPTIITKQQTVLVRDPFYEDYADAFDGRLPFVNPVAQTRWTWSDGVPDGAEEEATNNRTIFADWVNEHVLVPDERTCSNSLLFYRAPPAEVYRNIYRDQPSVPFGFSISTFSPFWGGPDFVLPCKYQDSLKFNRIIIVLAVGEASYFSNITLHEEFLPVTVNIMAARGCDGMLYGLVQDLVAEGMLKATVAGQSSVDGGQVLFKRTSSQ